MLQSSPEPLYPSLGLWRECLDGADAQDVQGLTELRKPLPCPPQLLHKGESGRFGREEDGVGVGINGSGNPVTEDGLFQDAELAVKTLCTLEPQGRDVSCGIIDGTMQGKHSAIPEPVIRRSIDLNQLTWAVATLTTIPTTLRFF